MADVEAMETEEINALLADDQEAKEGSVAKVSNPFLMVNQSDDDHSPDRSQTGRYYIGPMQSLHTHNTPSSKVNPPQSLPTAEAVMPVASGPLTPVIKARGGSKYRSETRPTREFGANIAAGIVCDQE